MSSLRTLTAVVFGFLCQCPSHAGEAARKTCCPACHSCDYVCQFSIEEATEAKTSFDVQCKAVCIPPITFPWERNGGQGKASDCSHPPRCGRVKVVRVLVKKQYECSRCKCKWTAVPIDAKKRAGETFSRDVVSVPETPPAAAARLNRPFDAVVKLSQYGADVSRRFVNALR